MPIESTFFKDKEGHLGVHNETVSPFDKKYKSSSNRQIRKSYRTDIAKREKAIKESNDFVGSVHNVLSFNNLLAVGIVFILFLSIYYTLSDYEDISLYDKCISICQIISDFGSNFKLTFNGATAQSTRELINGVEKSKIASILTPTPILNMLGAEAVEIFVKFISVLKFVIKLFIAFIVMLFRIFGVLF